MGGDGAALEAPQPAVRAGAISVLPSKILLATDGSEEPAAAVRVAVDPAVGTSSGLRVAYVLPTAPKPPYPRIWERERRAPSLDAARLGALALLEEKARRVEKLGGTVADTHYGEGEPAKKIARIAEEAGQGWFSRGPSEAVLRRAPCAVVVVRGPKEGR